MRMITIGDNCDGQQEILAHTGKIDIKNYSTCKESAKHIQFQTLSQHVLCTLIENL